MTSWTHKRIVVEIDALVADGFSDADINDVMQWHLDESSSLSSIDVDPSAVKVTRVRTRAVSTAEPNERNPA